MFSKGNFFDVFQRTTNAEKAFVVFFFFLTSIARFYIFIIVVISRLKFSAGGRRLPNGHHSSHESREKIAPQLESRKT